MKVIISHDVDHIDAKDHLLKDLILEKMFVRSILQLFGRRISFRTFACRTTMVFRKRMNRIDEIMAFDKAHNIPSVFFFGMSNTLGMSYSREKAKGYIEKVLGNGFDAGVHGCDYTDPERIREEHDNFAELSGKKDFGVRNHYVRYDDETFGKMEEAGYLFDSTRFNKTQIELTAPYKIGKMWEFPLHIMDGYVCEQGRLQEGLKKTFRIIDEAEGKDLNYLTILFHDFQYDDVFDPELKQWYEKTIEYCENKGFSFISYRDAIKELENEHNGVRE